MSTPSRPLVVGQPYLYVGVKVRHFRTKQVYEILNIMMSKEEGIVAKYAPVSNLYEPYHRPLIEFWDEVEAEPGVWVPRFEVVHWNTEE